MPLTLGPPHAPASCGALQAVAAHLRQSLKAGRVLMSVAPFAVATSSAGSANTLILVTRAVGSFIKLYLLLLFLRVLLSWFPKFEWDVQPWLALRQVGLKPSLDPALNPRSQTWCRFWVLGASRGVGHAALAELVPVSV